MLQKLADAVKMDVAEGSKNFGKVYLNKKLNAFADKIASGPDDSFVELKMLF